MSSHYLIADSASKRTYGKSIKRIFPKTFVEENKPTSWRTNVENHSEKIQRDVKVFKRFTERL